MPRQIEKKAFLFYASTLDILKELPEKRQGKVAMALIEYGLDNYNYFAEFSPSLSILDPVERIIFHSVIYEIDVQKRRYYNKWLIQGAIKTIQNIIAPSENLDSKTRDIYIDLIQILEMKYKDAIKHDSRNIPSELAALLPNEIFESFKNHYKVKFWKDYIKEMFEKRLLEDSISLSDDDKNHILSELIKDYAETSIPFRRYNALTAQYVNKV